jgi:hypothetical protein
LLFNVPKVSFLFHYLFQLFAFQLEKPAEKLKQTGPKYKARKKKAAHGPMSQGLTRDEEKH